MGKITGIALGKIAKKMRFQDHYLTRRIEVTQEHAYFTWSNPASFLSWFVPPELIVDSYKHDETQLHIVLRDHLGERQEYRMSYVADEGDFLIQLTGGRYFDDPHNHGDSAAFTIRFDEVSSWCEELEEDAKGTFVQLLIRHPSVAAWYAADGCGLHEFWTGCLRAVRRPRTTALTAWGELQPSPPPHTSPAMQHIGPARDGACTPDPPTSAHPLFWSLHAPDKCLKLENHCPVDSAYERANTEPASCNSPPAPEAPPGSAPSLGNSC